MRIEDSEAEALDELAAVDHTYGVKAYVRPQPANAAQKHLVVQRPAGDDQSTTNKRTAEPEPGLRPRKHCLACHAGEKPRRAKALGVWDQKTKLKPCDAVKSRGDLACFPEAATECDSSHDASKRARCARRSSA